LITKIIYTKLAYLIYYFNVNNFFLFSCSFILIFFISVTFSFSFLPFNSVLFYTWYLQIQILLFAEIPSGMSFNYKNCHSLINLFETLACTDRSSDVIRGIDVKSTADCEEDNGISSPNSAVSSVSGGKRSERDDDNAALVAGERTSCSRGSDDDDGGGGDGEGGEGGRKKLRLTKEQSMVLEETFKEHNTLNPVS